MITYAEVAIGSGGVAGCRSCGSREAVAHESPEDVAARLDLVAASWIAGAGPNVAFTGLDAFAHPNLPRLIEAARGRGFERIRVSTDGRFLDQGGNAHGARSAGVTDLELTLLAGDAETHDRLLGAPGAFHAATRGARDFGAPGADVVVSCRVPLCRHTIAHAPAAVAACAAAGAVAVHLEAGDLSQTPENNALLAAALETATVNRLAAFVTGWGGTLPEPYLMAPWALEPAQ